MKRSSCLLMAAVLLALSCNSLTILSQTETPAVPDKDAMKAADKARKDALKEAEKAIKDLNINRLKEILEANPDLVNSSSRSGAFQTTITAVVLTPVVGPDAVPLAIKAGSGSKLLDQAAIYNNVAAAELLLEDGANINAKNGMGATPLHEAILSRSWDVGRLLLDHGAEVNTRWMNGDSPLKTLRWERATRTRNQPRQQFDDFEQLLLQHGAR